MKARETIDRKEFFNRVLTTAGVVAATPIWKRAASAPLKAEIWQLGATDIAAGIRSKSFSCVEVVQTLLKRIAKVNPKVNAITVTLEEEALEAARAADQAVSRGLAKGPLFGVPFTVKENIDLAGSATTEGLTSLRDNLAPQDAPHIAQLKRVGAIPIARTNMPDFGLRFHTDNALRGATVNPWNPALTPGGSSGGEGVALATGMSPLGMGNDYGGSLRFPAQCGGIASLRPSQGRVAFAAGLSPLSFLPVSSQWFLVQGPMARRIADLRLALASMSGPDPRDPNWIPAPLWGPTPPKPIRVALCPQPEGGGVDSDIAEGVRKAGRILAEAGYEVEEGPCPGVSELAEVWTHLAVADIRGYFLRFMRERAAPDALKFLNLVLETVPEDDLLAYQNLLARRNAMRRSWTERSEERPLLVAPVSTRKPFRVGADLQEGEPLKKLLESMRMLVAVNLLGVPSVVVPVGTSEGVPLAVQVIGPMYREDLCLDAAERIEQSVGVLTPIDPRPSKE